MSAFKFQKRLKLRIGKVTSAVLGPHLAASGVPTRPIAAEIESVAEKYHGLKALVDVTVDAQKNFKVTLPPQESSTLLLREFRSRSCTRNQFDSFVQGVSRELLTPALARLADLGRNPGDPFYKNLEGTAKSITLCIR